MLNRFPFFRWIGLIVFALLEAACVPLPQREDTLLLRAQEQRESRLGEHPNWTLKARIAVSNGDDSGSGQLDWQQAGDRYDFTVRAPVTGKTWHLYGDAQQAVLEGVQAKPLVSADAERLLYESLGWRVPMAQLKDWVRGMRAPGMSADLSYNAQALPALLHQSGWTIEYKDYLDESSPAMPRKVFASKKAYRVRVVIEQWSFHD